MLLRDCYTCIGGIVGQVAYNMTTDNCYNKCSVSSTGRADNASVGGVVGLIQNASILSNCYNTASVSFDATGYNVENRVGGIVGVLHANSIIKNTYNIGVLNSVSSGITHIGGCVGGGYVSVSIDNCYSASDVGTDLIVAYKDADVSVTNSSMQAKENIKTLTNTLGEAFVNDTNNTNNGFPILSW